MRGLDTNVLLRVVTDDDPDQSATAREVLRRAATDNRVLHLDTIVLCELVWVLSSSYRYGRKMIAAALDRVLGTALFDIQDRDAVREAVALYRRGRGDFADYLLGCLNRRRGCADTLTFDSALRDSEDFSVLGPQGSSS